MQINDFIDVSIPAIRPTDHAEQALARLEDTALTQLPVINEKNQYKGIVSEEILYHATLLNNPPVSEIPLLFSEDYALTHQHFMTGLRLTKEGMDFIPVTDEFQTLLGVVPLSQMAKSFAQTHTIQQEGAIVVLWIKERDYSLSQISRLAETHHIKILGILTDKLPDSSDKLSVTFKLDTNEVSHFVATLERFEYEIAGIYTQNEEMAYDKKRLDLLFKYLEL